jgi:hypothetical protein
MSKLKVKFIVNGKDHSGEGDGHSRQPSCSPAEGEYYEEDTPKTVKKIIVNKFSDECFDSDDELQEQHLHKLNYFHDGCTSNGSRYCSGFYQYYRAVHACKIQDSDDEDNNVNSIN